MSQTQNAAIAVVGIDIGKNSFHIVGHDERGAIVLRQKWSRGQVEARFANMPPCLVGMEACVGAHHLSRKLNSLGHNARLMPAKYVRPYSRGQKNDFRDAEANVAKANRFVESPRVEVVIVPDSAGTDINSSSALFDLWLVLHVPDGKTPVTVRFEGGPFDRGSAVDKLSDAWNFIGTTFAEPTAKLGIYAAGSAKACRQS